MCCVLCMVCYALVRDGFCFVCCLLRAGVRNCCLSVAVCLVGCCVLCAVCWLLFVASRSLVAVCCLFVVVCRCSLVVRCLWQFRVCCSLCVT